MCFLVISIADEYSEEDDDDYEMKDMGCTTWMQSMNQLVLPTLSSTLHTGDETE